MPIGKVILPNLIWQPTFTCRSGCPNCYINKSPMKIFNEQKQRQLLSLLCSEELIVENEVIISLDTVPKRRRKDIQSEISLVSDILQCGSFRRHLAVRDIETLIFWTKRCPGLPWKLVSRISFSNPKGIREYPELIRNRKINWNFLSSGKFSGITKEDEELIETIHLILEKEELGRKIPQENIDKFLKMKEELSGSKKVITDKCWEASVNKKCCGASINRIHVWPNGSITGCPYDSNGVMGFNEETVLETLQKITYERKEHPWKICQLNRNNKQ